MAHPTRRMTKQIRQTLRRRMGVLAMEKSSDRNNAAVQRILTLLSDENLTELAANSRNLDKLTLECGVLQSAWADPRVTNRVNQLSKQDVKVRQEMVTSTFGETEMQRMRIVVEF